MTVGVDLLSSRVVSMVLFVVSTSTQEAVVDELDGLLDALDDDDE